MTTYIATIISSDEELFRDACSELDTLLFYEGVKTVRTEILSPGKAIDYHLNFQSFSKDMIDSFRKELFELSKTTKVDIIFQLDTQARKEKGLVVFDMDSTLIQQEVIDMIAAYANVEPEVSKITEAAMNGEIDFNESLRQRVGLLKGVTSNVFELLKPQIEFTPGAKSLCKALKASGAKLAVLSGGFIPLAQWVKQELGLDYAYANNLEISEDGTQLTGKTFGRIINNIAKAELLEEIAQKENVYIENTIAIGDGSNDLLMMEAAGFGIAFNAKPIVQLKAPSKINTDTLETVLYVLGYTDQEIEELLNQ